MTNGLSVRQLLNCHVEIMEALRARGVLRSANNPTGDLAEWLFCRAFGWDQAANSVKGYDATDDDGARYQIKARRVHRRNPSRQLSAIRDLNGFDYLAGVIFDDDFNVSKAAIIPANLLRDRVRFSKHTNSHLFFLTDDIWALAEVRDVTAQIAAALD